MRSDTTGERRWEIAIHIRLPSEVFPWQVLSRSNTQGFSREQEGFDITMRRLAMISSKHYAKNIAISVKTLELFEQREFMLRICKANTKIKRVRKWLYFEHLVLEKSLLENQGAIKSFLARGR